MEPCELFHALGDQPADTDPHSTLAFMGATPHRLYSVPIRDIERYKCSACGIKWKRDIHPIKSKAKWKIFAGRKQP